MPRKVGLSTTFIALLVLVAVMLLVGWYVWMSRTQKGTPTSPGSPAPGVPSSLLRLDRSRSA